MTVKEAAAEKSADEDEVLAEEIEDEVEVADEAEGEEGEQGEEAAEEKTEGDDKEEKPEEHLTKSRRKREAQRARIATLEQIAQREADRADAAAAALAALTAEVGPEPKEADYSDKDSYLAARAGWEADRRAVARQKKASETALDGARKEAGQSREKLFRERAMSLTERYPDIEAKIFNDASLPISQAMADVLMDSERGPEVTYYLATHREEAGRIAGMRPLAAARELGRIEATLTAPKPKTVTTAPKPVPRVKGASAKAVKSPDDMTADEWREWRDGQLRRKRA